MIYSCFDDARGVYRYYKDDTGRPMNSDLPVPTLTGETKTGYPSIDAARPLPSGAKPFGQGWHARGIVVRCGSGLSGLGAVEFDKRSVLLVLAGVASGIVIYQLVRNRKL
jgi:hypothetical protein